MKNQILRSKIFCGNQNIIEQNKKSNTKKQNILWKSQHNRPKWKIKYEEAKYSYEIQNIIDQNQKLNTKKQNILWKSKQNRTKKISLSNWRWYKCKNIKMMYCRPKEKREHSHTF